MLLETHTSPFVVIRSLPHQPRFHVLDQISFRAFRHYEFGVQWNLDFRNLYLTKTSIQLAVFFTPVVVKYMKKNLDLTKEFGRSPATS